MSRIRESDGDVLAATRAMYAAYGDPDAFDAHLHPDVTVWESDRDGPPIGLAELGALRNDRITGPDAPRPTLTVHDPVVDRWSGAAVIRYVLRAEVAGTVTEFRVTDVLDGRPPGAGPGPGWRVVHHHAEHLLAGAEAPQGAAVPDGGAAVHRAG